MKQEVEFLEFLVKNLVKNPDEINIESDEDELWILLTLKVAEDDMGLVIWKAWKTVNSIRTLLRALWAKEQKRINLKVLD